MKIGVFLVMSGIVITLIMVTMSTPSIRAISVYDENVVVIEDSYIDERDNTTNYGKERAAFVGTWDGENAIRSVTYFDLTSIQENSIVVSATLNMKLSTNALSDNENFSIYRITTEWSDEDEITWIDASSTVTWTSPGGDYENVSQSSAIVTPTTPTEEYISWEIDNLVQYWVTDNNSNYGMLIKGNENAGYVAFYTSEKKKGIDIPYLEVNYNPPGGVTIGVTEVIESLLSFEENTVKIKWTVSENAQTYHLQVDDRDTFVYPYVYENDNVVHTDITLPLERYRTYWRVRGVSETHTGDWSPTVTFIYDRDPSSILFNTGAVSIGVVSCVVGVIVMFVVMARKEGPLAESIEREVNE